MIILYDVCKLYRFVVCENFGYVCEIGESISEDWCTKLIVVFETLYDKEVSFSNLISDPHYYITHTSQYGVENQIRGIAKKNKFSGKKYEIEYSYADFDNQQIIKSIAFANFEGEYENKFKNEVGKKYRNSEFNFIKYSYRWLIMDEEHNNVHSQTTDKGIVSLPPYSQSIETCLQWWSEGLTVSKWNDDYCRQIIVLRKNTDDRNNANTIAIKDLMLAFINCEGDKLYSIKNLLVDFEYKLLKVKTYDNAVKLLKTIYKNISALGLDIDTSNRELLFQYFSQLLKHAGFESVVMQCESCRDW